MAMDITIQVFERKTSHFFRNFFFLIELSNVCILLVVEITIRGTVDPKTGMVMNITELKDYIERVIMKTLDHKNLDKDVDYFTNGGRVCWHFKTQILYFSHRLLTINSLTVYFLSVYPVYSPAPLKMWPCTFGKV